MRWIASLAIGLFACASAAAQDPAPAPAAAEELLPFELFFTPAEYEAPLLSPDGRMISYIGRHNGAYNIFVAPVDNIAAARPLTQESGRGIQWYSVSGAVTYQWTPDGQHILYEMDNNGDENYRLYAVSVATGQTRNLTPGERVRAHLLQVSTRHPTRILAAVDHRFTHAHLSMLFSYDIVEIDIVTGERRVVMENIPYASVVADNDLNVRLVGRSGAVLYGHARRPAGPFGGLADQFHSRERR
jgi:hypothetical protein